MGRFTTNKAYGHRIQMHGADNYTLFWTVDRYYVGSRLRHPVGYRRAADEAGAKRFAKKHKIEIPPED